MLAAGRLYFSAGDDVFGTELWVSDGTEAGTTLAADVHVVRAGSNPTHLTASNDPLFFVADNGSTGNELWSVDIASDSWLDGDINANGELDLQDLLILVQNFGRQTERGLADGDLDGGGQVDFQDFLEIACRFDHSRRSATG